MKKETFIKLVSELVSIKRDEENLQKAFKKFEPDFNHISFGRYETLVVRAIEEAVGDEYDNLSYWLYDRNAKFTKEKIITDKDGKNIPIKSLGQLYDLIVGSKE